MIEFATNPFSGRTDVYLRIDRDWSFLVTNEKLRQFILSEWRP